MKTAKKSLGVLAVVFSLFLPTWSASAQVRHLPLSSFIDVQFEAAPWTDPASGNVLVFDLYGARAAIFGLHLGTTVQGGVAIRDLGNGTERVTVNWQTRNAVCAGFNANGEPAFGRLPVEIAAGAPASLGDGHTIVEFTQPSGSSMPTQFEILSGIGGRVAENFMTSVMCQNGELRVGSGFPEGTRGFAQTTQVALLSTGVPTGCPPEKDGDCFPAEKVQFMPTGH